MDDQPARTAQARQTNLPPKKLISLGLVFMAFASIILYTFGETSTLVCTRANMDTVNGVIHRTWMGIARLSDRRVDGILGAELYEGSDGEGGTTYGIRLLTRYGPVNLGFATSIGTDSKNRTIRRINAFVQDPHAMTLVTEPQSTGGAVLINTGLLAAGLLLTVYGLYATRRVRPAETAAASGAMGDSNGPLPGN